MKIYKNCDIRCYIHKEVLVIGCAGEQLLFEENIQIISGILITCLQKAEKESILETISFNHGLPL